LVLIIRRYWKTFQSELPCGSARKIIGLKLELLYPVLNAKKRLRFAAVVPKSD